LRVLLVEDCEDDAHLILQELRAGGYRPIADRVDTAAGLAAALTHDWDLVLCDCVLPSFSGAEAVAQIRAQEPSLPVIIVTGHTAAAGDALRAGADGFVSKRRLSALLPALVRGQRPPHPLTQPMPSIDVSLNDRWQLLFDQAPVGIVQTDATGQVTAANPELITLLGSPSVEATLQFNVLMLEQLRPHGIRDAFARVLAGGPMEHLEAPYRSAWGRHADLSLQVVGLRDRTGAVCGSLAIVQDQTDKVRTVSAQQDAAQQLEETVAKLRASQAELRALVDSLAGVVWEADPLTFTFSFVSEAAARLLGHPREAWLEPGFFAAQVHPDEIAVVADACRRATARGEDHVLEYRMRSADGRWVWVRDLVTVVTELGAPVRLRGVMVDVSAQKESEAALRANQERFRRLVEHANEAIALVDRDGLVTYLSSGNLRTLGYTYEDRIGTSPLDNVHPDDQADLAATMATPGATFEGRVRVRHADGSWRWVEGVMRNLLDDSTVAAIVANYRDVTEQVEAREQIERLNVELERRVSERTLELEAANCELEAFSYSVSHDLRAPLRAVLGFTRIVREEQGAVLPSAAQAQLDKVVAAGSRMETLIDSLLELSRTTRGELRRRRIDLAAMARLVASELQQAEPGRQATLTIAGDLSASADPSLAYLLLENLLGNAWKYTRPRAVAEICVGRVGHDAFFVRDNGVGFDMAYAQRLFMPFQRLHDTGMFEGTGIGLATVQRIVSRHGGRIWAESVPDAGATFYFTLEPAAPRRGSPAAAR
jgi:PAS domain S-box-containing protein